MSKEEAPRVFHSYFSQSVANFPRVIKKNRIQQVSPSLAVIRYAIACNEISYEASFAKVF